MTIDDIEQFFKDRPAITKTAICREASISKGLLDYMLKGEKPLTDKTISKLTPVFKRYGYKC